MLSCQLRRSSSDRTTQCFTVQRTFHHTGTTISQHDDTILYRSVVFKKVSSQRAIIKHRDRKLETLAQQYVLSVINSKRLQIYNKKKSQGGAAKTIQQPTAFAAKWILNYSAFCQHCSHSPTRSSSRHSYER